MSDIDKIITLFDMADVPYRRRENRVGCTVVAAGRKFYADKKGEIYKVEDTE